MQVSKETVQLLSDGKPEWGCQPWASEGGTSAHSKRTWGGDWAVVLKLQLHQNHLEIWRESGLLSPTPESLISFLLGGA